MLALQSHPTTGAVRLAWHILFLSSLMDKLVQDLRFALRSLMRQPGFALTAVVTLALGIGATTAIFSVVNAVLLRPLPFERPDRIVAVDEPVDEDRAARASGLGAGLRRLEGAEPELRGDGATTRAARPASRSAASADYASVFRVTPGFFEALGARAAVGPAADRRGAEARRPAGGRHHRCVLARAVQRRSAGDRLDRQVRRPHLHHRRRARAAASASRRAPTSTRRPGSGRRRRRARRHNYRVDRPAARRRVGASRRARRC